MQESTRNEIIPIPEATRVCGTQERQIAIDGVTWRYLTAGAGPALLLVHGLMGYTWSWRFNMEAMSQHFTVYAPDLPGTGFSERLNRLPGSLESDAENLLKFMDKLDIEEAYVLGTSRGGGVSVLLAALAARRNQLHRIPRMILSAPINPWSKFGQLRARLLATRTGNFCTLHLIPHMPFLLKKYFRDLYGDPNRIAPGSLEGYEAGLRPPGSFEHLNSIMHDWHQGLRQIGDLLPHMSDLPVLLLWGSLDKAVYPSSAYEIGKRLRNSTLLMVEGVGHMPYEEVPDEFNRIVRDFFLEHRPRTPLESSEEGQHATTPITPQNIGAQTQTAVRDLSR